jgi:hypothetical protein
MCGLEQDGTGDGAGPRCCAARFLQIQGNEQGQKGCLSRSVFVASESTTNLQIANVKFKFLGKNILQKKIRKLNLCFFMYFQ